MPAASPAPTQLLNDLPDDKWWLPVLAVGALSGAVAGAVAAYIALRPSQDHHHHGRELLPPDQARQSRILPQDAAAGPRQGRAGLPRWSSKEAHQHHHSHQQQQRRDLIARRQGLRHECHAGGFACTVAGPTVDGDGDGKAVVSLVDATACNQARTAKRMRADGSAAAAAADAGSDLAAAMARSAGGLRGGGEGVTSAQWRIVTATATSPQGPGVHKGPATAGGLVGGAAAAVSHLQSPLQAFGRRDPTDPAPRSGSLSWDDYFMALAFLSAERSKDPNKQVGAVIVNADNVILGIGYNGFPRGCCDSHLPWAKEAVGPGGGPDPLGTKYPYVVHAEANALLNKNSASVAGARVYVTMFPCNECAKLLIQAGVREVVYHEDKVVHLEGEGANGPGNHSHHDPAAPMGSGLRMPAAAATAASAGNADRGIDVARPPPSPASVAANADVALPPPPASARQLQRERHQRAAAQQQQQHQIKESRSAGLCSDSPRSSGGGGATASPPVLTPCSPLYGSSSGDADAEDAADLDADVDVWSAVRRQQQQQEQSSHVVRQLTTPDSGSSGSTGSASLASLATAASVATTAAAMAGSPPHCTAFLASPLEATPSSTAPALRAGADGTAEAAWSGFWSHPRDGAAPALPTAVAAAPSSAQILSSWARAADADADDQRQETAAAAVKTQSSTQAKAKAGADVCYLASLRLLRLAGVTLRQHKLQRVIAIPGPAAR